MIFSHADIVRSEAQKIPNAKTPLPFLDVRSFAIHQSSFRVPELFLLAAGEPSMTWAFPSSPSTEQTDRHRTP